MRRQIVYVRTLTPLLEIHPTRTNIYLDGIFVGFQYFIIVWGTLTPTYVRTYITSEISFSTGTIPVPYRVLSPCTVSVLYGRLPITVEFGNVPTVTSFVEHIFLQLFLLLEKRRNNNLDTFLVDDNISRLSSHKKYRLSIF